MIALSVLTSVIGVAQTWISNQVGQRVMHDLRAAVYAHLQRMSLAFFTRTRTGEVQSRIANDIGGVDNVVTSTATSIVQNVTTVVATVVAMFLLDWRLAVFSLILLPFFVWLTRRVGEERRRIQSVRQSRLADMSTLVEESLSVSGILLGKTMGRSPELVRRFSDESGELADLEVRARMAGRWRMATVQMSFAIMPALVYLFGGISIGGRPRDLDRHGRRLHDPADAAAVPDPVAAVGRPRSADLAGAVRPDLRVPGPAGRHRRAPRRASARATSAATCAWRTSGSATRRRRPGRCAEIDAEIPAGTRTALVGETGSGKTTLAYLVARLYEPERGCVSIDGVDIRDVTLDVARGHRRPRLPGDLPVPRLDPREPPLRLPGGDRRGDRRRRPRGADPRADRVAARRLRHAGRRARLPLLRR